jgi:hypothetical protein
MQEKIRKLVQQQWAGLIALFLVLSGGTAVASHETIFSDDIVDGEVKSADVRNDSLSGGGLAAADLRAGSVQSSEVLNDSLTGTDIANTDSLGTAEISEANLFNDNSLDATDVSDASTLGAAEINEAGLGTVPRATDANMVQGNEVRVVAFRTENNGGSSGGGGLGGLGLNFRCNLTGFGQEPGDLDVNVSTNTDNSTLAVSDDDSYEDVEDFDVADGNVDLEKLVGADTDEIINLVYTKPRPAGGFAPVVSGQIHILDDAPAGDTPECVLAGHLISHD